MELSCTSNDFKDTADVTHTNTIFVPRILVDPVVDGSCSSKGYQERTNMTIGNTFDQYLTEVKLFHSGWNLYICFFRMRTEDIQKIVIRFTTRNNGGENVVQGDYEIIIRQDDDLKLRTANDTGKFFPLPN